MDTVGIMMRVSKEDKQLLSDAAHLDKKSMSAWMREVLIKVAKHNLGVKDGSSK